jgi:muramidase (phage lysozyme)
MSLVDSLLSAGKENSKRLESMEKTLAKMLKNDKKSAELEKSQAKKAEQNAKRLAADRKKEQNNNHDELLEENNSILRDIHKSLKRVSKNNGGGGGGGIPGLLPAVAAAAKPIATAAAAAATGFGLAGGLGRGVTGAQSNVGNQIGGAGQGNTTDGKKLSYTYENIIDKLNAMKAFKDIPGANLTEEEGKTLDANIEKMETLADRMRQTKSLNDQLHDQKKKFKRVNQNLLLDDDGNERTDEFARINNKQVKERMDELSQTIQSTEQNLRQSKKIQQSIVESTNLTQELIDKQTLKSRAVDNTIYGMFASKEDKARVQTLKDLGLWKGTREELIQGRQTGGPITVPGSGSGDKVPMMLPPGSFVLNRNASNFLRRQTGGNVPTMLEPGELVYLNENIPRFQSGGEVRSSGPKGKDSTPPPKADTSKIGNSGVFFKKDADIKPGGKMTFIGDGSGFTGEIKLIDGLGKVVAQIGGVSGVARNAGATQEQRSNVSGTLNPLPDGNYPLEQKTARHPGQTVGEWSSWVNNPSGNIGRRGQIFVHNDIGSNGTAGCIGVEAGGSRGSKNSMMFAEMYDKVQPKNVEVNLTSSSGGSYAPGGSADGSESNGAMASMGKLGLSAAAILGPGTTALLGMAGIAMPSLDMGFNALGIAGGAMDNVKNILGSLFGGGDSSSDSSDNTGAGYGPAGAGGSGATSISDPNAKALLNTIADAEGTSLYPNQGYNTQFTGKQFKGTNHPREVIRSGGYGSDAAGRYQFLSTTWDEYSNGRDMSPENQDQVALDLVSKKRGVDISDGLSRKEVLKLGQEWASIEGGPNGVPGGSYGGQAKFSADKFLAMYKSYGGKIQGLQTGGMVPTMLEPGETVFGPGQWNSSIKQLNSAVPRFQSGGMISKSSNPMNEVLAEVEKMVAMNATAPQQPMVVPIPAGNTVKEPTMSTENAPPPMPVGPSVNFLSDIINRVNMGSVFS